MTESYSQFQFAGLLSEGFSHIRTQLATEEHRLLDLSQNYRHKLFQGTSHSKRARIDQLVDVRDSINLHLVSPALQGLKDGLLGTVTERYSRIDESEDEPINVDKVSGEQSEKLKHEVKKSQAKICDEIEKVFCGGHTTSMEKIAYQFGEEMKTSIQREFRIGACHPSESSCDNQPCHLNPKINKPGNTTPPTPKPDEPAEETDWKAPDYRGFTNICAKSPDEAGFGDLKGVAVDENNIFVVDKKKNEENHEKNHENNHRVHVWGLDLKLVTSIKAEEMVGPYGIAVSNEYVYVTDTESHSVLCFMRDSFKLHKKVGEKGRGNKNFSSPKGLCVDSHCDNDVYIADCNNNRVLVYTKDLKFKHKITLAGETDGGAKDCGLKNPQDVAATQKTVVVLDWGGLCVKFFIKGGGPNCHIRSCVNQARNQAVAKPSFFCVDPLKNLIISDFLNHRIAIFDKNGKPIHQFGENGSDKGQMVHPTGVAMTKDNKIVVISENKNHGVQVF